LTLVAGDFKSSATEGVVIEEFSNIGSACMSALSLTSVGIPVYDRYFESEHFRVFSTDGDENYMHLLATISEEALESVSGKFQLTSEEILAYRQNYSDTGFEQIYQILNRDLDEESTVFTDLIGVENLPTDFETFYNELPVEDRYSFYYRYLKDLSQDDFDLVITELNDFHPNNLDRHYVPRKIQVCASALSGVGQATTEEIRANTDSNLSDDLKSNNYQSFRRIMQHEMVHMAEMIVTGHFWAESATNWWFAEGVAEYLTEGKKSSNRTAFNPLTYGVTGSNELIYQGHSLTDIYAVFNSSVDYLFSSETPKLGHGVDGVLKLWLAIRNSDKKNGVEGDERAYTFGEGDSSYQVTYKPPFIDAFERTFNTLDGQDFSHANYENEYMTIHNSY
jgi:hypothetical protein